MNDPTTRLVVALRSEDHHLCSVISAIRNDQQNGHMTAHEAADNVAEAKKLHAGHCDLLTAAHTMEGGS